MDEVERAELVRLERALWDEATRFDPAFMTRVLADDFLEFGRSGRQWTRAMSIDVPAEPIGAELHDLALHEVAPGVVLVTYRSTQSTEPDGRPALRSSLWVSTPDGWRLRFHQGTPTA